MGKRLRPKKYLMPMERGRSTPHLIRFDDNRKYVVKFKNNPQGDWVLLHEYMVYHLAKWLKLPVPRLKVVHVPDEFIRKTKQLNNFKGGSQAASRFVKNTSKLSEIKRTIEKKDINNRKHAAGIIVFDHWVDNVDRNLRNILLEPKGNKYSIRIIDNANCLGEPKKYHSEKIPIAIRNLKAFQWCLSIMDSEKELLSFVKAIQKFPNKEILRILSRIPKDWNIPESEKQRLYRRLQKSRDQLPRKITNFINKYVRNQ